jgi:hypothetical protein
LASAKFQDTEGIPPDQMVVVTPFARRMWATRTRRQEMIVDIEARDMFGDRFLVKVKTIDTIAMVKTKIHETEPSLQFPAYLAFIDAREPLDDTLTIGDYNIEPEQTLHMFYDEFVDSNEFSVSVQAVGGSTTDMVVKATMFVGEITDIIQWTTGMWRNRHELLYGDTILRFDKSLYSYGIVSETMLTVIVYSPSAPRR